MIFGRGGAACLVLAMLSPPALAQSPATLALTGRVAHARVLSMADLLAMPQVSAEQPAAHGSGPVPISGVLLWPLLDQAGWVDQPGRKTHEQHMVFARGRDGYAVALSIGEIDPSLEGKPVLVVTSRAGQTLGELDLYVPGDHRAARRVHDLVSIDMQ